MPPTMPVVQSPTASSLSTASASLTNPPTMSLHGSGTSPKLHSSAASTSNAFLADSLDHSVTIRYSGDLNANPPPRGTALHSVPEHPLDAPSRSRSSSRKRPMPRGGSGNDSATPESVEQSVSALHRSGGDSNRSVSASGGEPSVSAVSLWMEEGLSGGGAGGGGGGKESSSVRFQDEEFREGMFSMSSMDDSRVVMSEDEYGPSYGSEMDGRGGAGAGAGAGGAGGAGGAAGGSEPKEKWWWCCPTLPWRRAQFLPEKTVQDFHWWQERVTLVAAVVVIALLQSAVIITRAMTGEDNMALSFGVILAFTLVPLIITVPSVPDGTSLGLMMRWWVVVAATISGIVVAVSQVQVFWLVAVIPVPSFVLPPTHGLVATPLVVCASFTTVFATDLVEEMNAWGSLVLAMLGIGFVLCVQIFMVLWRSEEAVIWEKLYGVVLNGTFEGVVLLDRDLRIRRYNIIMIHMFGSATRLDGQPLESIIHPRDHTRLRSVLQQVSNTRFLVELDALGGVDMTPIPVELSVVRIQGFLVCSFRSMVHRKEMETLLVEAKENELLAKEKLVQEARRQATLKSAFISTVTHELRTPLHAIIGTADLLNQEDVPRQVQDLIKGLLAASESLSGLVNDILDHEKLDADAFEFEERNCDISDVVSTAIRMVATKAHAKGVELAYWAAPDVPPVLTGDPSRYKQVLLNLLSNAVKFTHKGGQIVVLVSGVSRLTRDAEGRSTVMIETLVMDSGIGMNPMEMERVFQPFSQANASTTRKYGGTGLGLSISRKLAQRMGGNISVFSRKGVGTTFSFKASFGTVIEPESILMQRDKLDLPVSGNVVVVYRNVKVRSLIKQQLQDWSLSVQEAGTLDDVPRTADGVAALILDMDYIKNSTIGAMLAATFATVVISIPGKDFQDATNLAESAKALTVVAKPIDWQSLKNALVLATSRFAGEAPAASLVTPGGLISPNQSLFELNGIGAAIGTGGHSTPRNAGDIYTSWEGRPGPGQVVNIQMDASRSTHTLEIGDRSLASSAGGASVVSGGGGGGGGGGASSTMGDSVGVGEGEEEELGEPAPDVDKKLIRVAVVDDEPVSSRISGKMIRAIGFTDMEAFQQPEKMLESHAAVPFDVIFLDLNMPGMDGFEAAAKVLEMSNEAGTPPPILLALSGTSDPEQIARTSSVGFLEIVPKPCKLEALREVLTRITSTLKVGRGGARGPQGSRPRKVPSPRGVGGSSQNDLYEQASSQGGGGGGGGGGGSSGGTSQRTVGMDSRSGLSVASVEEESPRYLEVAAASTPTPSTMAITMGSDGSTMDLEEARRMIVELSSKPAAVAGPPPLVIIADGNRAHAESIATILGQFRLEVQIEESGSRILQIWEENVDRVSTVLVSILLKDTDGTSVTAWIRQREAALGRTKPVPIVITGTMAQQVLFQRCLLAGATECIVKPIHRAHLFQSLRRYMVLIRDLGSLSGNSAYVDKIKAHNASFVVGYRPSDPQGGGPNSLIHRTGSFSQQAHAQSMTLLSSSLAAHLMADSHHKASASNPDNAHRGGGGGGGGGGRAAGKRGTNFKTRLADLSSSGTRSRTMETSSSSSSYSDGYSSSTLDDSSDDDSSDSGSGSPTVPSTHSGYASLETSNSKATVRSSTSKTTIKSSTSAIMSKRSPRRPSRARRETDSAAGSRHASKGSKGRGGGRKRRKKGKRGRKGKKARSRSSKRSRSGRRHKGKDRQRRRHKGKEEVDEMEEVEEEEKDEVARMVQREGSGSSVVEVVRARGRARASSLGNKSKGVILENLARRTHSSELLQATTQKKSLLVVPGKGGVIQPPANKHSKSPNTSSLSNEDLVEFARAARASERA